MTTIPQRLREIAQAMVAPYPEYGMPPSPYDMARLIKAIAAELEAPAADAVPVVAYLYEDAHGNQYLHQAHNTAWVAPPQPLIRKSDHTASVWSLQDRINALEARQWFLADETDDSQDGAWSDAADAYAKAAGCLRGHLEWRDRIRAAVRVLIAGSNPSVGA